MIIILFVYFTIEEDSSRPQSPVPKKPTIVEIMDEPQDNDGSDKEKNDGDMMEMKPRREKVISY